MKEGYFLRVIFEYWLSGIGNGVEEAVRLRKNWERLVEGYKLSAIK